MIALLLTLLTDLRCVQMMDWYHAGTDSLWQIILSIAIENRTSGSKTLSQLQDYSIVNTWCRTNIQAFASLLCCRRCAACMVSISLLLRKLKSTQLSIGPLDYRVVSKIS